MESADKENDTPNRNIITRRLKGKHCRRVGNFRLTGSRRRDTPAGSRHTMMSTLASFLSIIGSMSSPVAAASLHSATNRKIGFRNRRQRRAAGERNVKRRLIVPKETDSYHTPVFRYDPSPKTYYDFPGPNHPKTKAAKKYDRSWYVSGTLTQPEYEIGDPVWVYSRAGWIRGTVQVNQLATETGLYQLKVENPVVISKILGGVPVKLCKTITAGGAYVLKRGKHNGVEDSSSCSEDSSDSSEDNSDSSEDISCDEDTSGEPVVWMY